jgi:hypothetical protein
LYDFLFARCVEEQQFGPFRVYRVLRGGSTGTSVPALNPAFQDGLD